MSYSNQKSATLFQNNVETRHSTHNIKQPAMAYYKERIMESQHLHKDLKGDYLKKIAAKPVDSYKIFNEFLKQEERIQRVKNLPL